MTLIPFYTVPLNSIVASDTNLVSSVLFGIVIFFRVDIIAFLHATARDLDCVTKYPDECRPFFASPILG